MQCMLEIDHDSRKYIQDYGLYHLENASVPMFAFQDAKRQPQMPCNAMM